MRLAYERRRLTIHSPTSDTHYKLLQVFGNLNDKMSVALETIQTLTCMCCTLASNIALDNQFYVIELLVLLWWYWIQMENGKSDYKSSTMEMSMDQGMMMMGFWSSVKEGRAVERADMRCHGSG